MTRAVTDTIGPVALRAEAGSVARSALELALGNGGHVVDAELSAGAKGGLSRGGAGKGSNDGE